MKKLSFVLFLIYLCFQVNAQTFLYKGISSGMTKEEFVSYSRSNSEFKFIRSLNSFRTIISWRDYGISDLYNNDGKLCALMFISSSRYEWEYYNPNIKENALELFNLLNIKYGEPTYNVWLDWTDIPKGKNKIVCVFEKDPITATIIVSEYADKYSVSLIIFDKKFEDPEVKNTEGF